MDGYLERNIQKVLEESIKDYPVVALLGPMPALYP
jgi:hypothetical protein